ncbi:hypothetical protein H1C71_000783 [Ictidomys tridecemlineatus]|nr:hypothetical protein H1C71_000783 [Ictidomys tridecemlineatus]KAG3264499.1 hypothetical protein H1C71_000783 [Ictidomys tridecemlineatus]
MIVRLVSSLIPELSFSCIFSNSDFCKWHPLMTSEASGLTGPRTSNIFKRILGFVPLQETSREDKVWLEGTSELTGPPQALYRVGSDHKMEEWLYSKIDTELRTWNLIHYASLGSLLPKF